jgi:hypothetical protein
MSIKFILISAATITSGLFLGYQATQLVLDATNSDEIRSIASSSETKSFAKMQSEQVAKNYLNIQLVTEQIAVKKSDPSIIKVIITAVKDLPTGIKYNWLLHSDVITADAISGSLEEMKSGEKTEIKIQVTGFSKEVRTFINFKISGKIGTLQIHRNLITSSRPEDSFEYIVENSFANEKNTGKIQKLSNGKSVRKKFDIKKVVN